MQKPLLVIITILLRRDKSSGCKYIHICAILIKETWFNANSFITYLQVI